jgi:FtsH-binding integral membrane protein
MGFSYPTPSIVRTGVERATLVRRTYGLVFASVLVTMLGVAFGFTQPALMGAVVAHPWLAFFCTLVPLMLATRVQQTFPANIGFVFLFTFVEGVWLAPFIAFFERLHPGVTGQAALLTGSTFGVLTLYAFVSRRDFSAWGGFFTVGLWVLIATALLNLFVRSAAADLWIAAATLLVFGGLLIYRTWQIRNVYGPDDYVVAAVAIYLALLNMFLAILRLLAGGRRN